VHNFCGSCKTSILFILQPAIPDHLQHLQKFTCWLWLLVFVGPSTSLPIHGSLSGLGLVNLEYASALCVIHALSIGIGTARRTLPRHYNGPPTCLHECTSSSLVCRNADFGRPVDPSFYTWRPSVSGGCRTRLELFAVLAARSPVTDDVQTPLESRTIRFQLYLTVLLHYQHVCL